MDYLSKVTGSALSLAKQSIQVISTSMANTNDLRANEVVQTAGTENPQMRVVHLFKEICRLIESIARAPDFESFEADQRLQKSAVRSHIKEIIFILAKEARATNQQAAAAFVDPSAGLAFMPCMDVFLQHRMVQELCNRAILDAPRGCLPLILTAMATLLHSVPYPLLPHMSVHKPLANLVSVAVRYDAMHMYNSSNNNNGAGLGKNGSMQLEQQQEYADYKRRVGKWTVSCKCEF
jgi:hypothetical protein